MCIATRHFSLFTCLFTFVLVGCSSDYTFEIEIGNRDAIEMKDGLTGIAYLYVYQGLDIGAKVAQTREFTEQEARSEFLFEFDDEKLNVDCSPGHPIEPRQFYFNVALDNNSDGKICEGDYRQFGISELYNADTQTRDNIIVTLDAHTGDCLTPTEGCNSSLTSRDR